MLFVNNRLGRFFSEYQQSSKHLNISLESLSNLSEISNLNHLESEYKFDPYNFNASLDYLKVTFLGKYQIKNPWIHKFMFNK